MGHTGMLCAILIWINALVILTIVTIAICFRAELGKALILARSLHASSRATKAASSLSRGDTKTKAKRQEAVPGGWTRGDTSTPQPQSPHKTRPGISMRKK